MSAKIILNWHKVCLNQYHFEGCPLCILFKSKLIKIKYATLGNVQIYYIIGSGEIVNNYYYYYPFRIKIMCDFGYSCIIIAYLLFSLWYNVTSNHFTLYSREELMHTKTVRNQSNFNEKKKSNIRYNIIKREKKGTSCTRKIEYWKHNNNNNNNWVISWKIVTKNDIYATRYHYYHRRIDFVRQLRKYQVPTLPTTGIVL